jgi:steroid delta-isomerase-like uncharacterized protein
MNDVEKNKQLVHAWTAALNEKNIEAALTHLADDFVNHAALPGSQGKDAMPRLFGILWKAMPDLKWKLEDVIAERDRVVCRVTMTGTQTGPLEFKNAPFPATGREIVTEQIHVFRVANGKAVEHWAGRDDIGFMRQLGVGPFAGK